MIKKAENSITKMIYEYDIGMKEEKYEQPIINKLF